MARSGKAQTLSCTNLGPFPPYCEGLNNCPHISGSHFPHLSKEANGVQWEVTRTLLDAWARSLAQVCETAIAGWPCLGFCEGGLGYGKAQWEHSSSINKTLGSIPSTRGGGGGVRWQKHLEKVLGVETPDLDS